MRLSRTLAFSLSLAACVACSSKKFSGGTDSAAAAKKEAATQDSPPNADSQPAGDTVAANTASFGTVDEIFRIGDGTSGAQSACIAQLKEYDLKGTVYYFQFEVTADSTAVDLSIGKVCGVDSENFTTVSVIDANSKEVIIPEKIVPTDASGQRPDAYQPFATTTFNKGLYSLVLTSKNKLGKPAGTAVVPGTDEYDDFIVGNIVIKGDKPVKSVKIYAE